jgi:hypothetical protein
MKNFGFHGRVKVTRPDEEKKELAGKFGTITRKLIRDESAWVKMDDPLPRHLSRFPVEDSRADDIILWPDECDPA